MKKVLAIAAVTVGLSVASIPANAQGYVVNGHNASKAEVQLLVSHGAQPGKWPVGTFSDLARILGQSPSSGWPPY